MEIHDKIIPQPISQNFKPDNIAVDVHSLFRLPWKTSDNAMGWLEPTRKCNMSCDACFAINDPQSQKSLKQIEKELDTLLHIRRCDAILIAGGEPLTHPQIVDVVRMVKKRKVKPQIVTNGLELDQTLIHELRVNGAYGITFHVDSHQSRPGWIGKNEMELNELRQQFVNMTRSEGHLVCAFNTTIFPDTLRYVPDIISWTYRNISDVSVMTLIAVRMIDSEYPFDYFVGNRKVDLNQMGFYSEHHYENLTTFDLYRETQKAIRDFKFCAFIGGTTLPQSLKWGISCRIGSNRESYGNIGPTLMELMQNAHHFWKGRYLAYVSPRLSKKAKFLFLLGFLDAEVRRTLRNYARAIIHHPSRIFEKLSTQTISLLQPIDILQNGEQDNCDGCPNGTVWQDRVVPACQLDNYMKFGGPVTMVPKQQA